MSGLLHTLPHPLPFTLQPPGSARLLAASHTNILQLLLLKNTLGQGACSKGDAVQLVQARNQNQGLVRRKESVIVEDEYEMISTKTMACLAQQLL